MTRQINPKKLLNSKWTATSPQAYSKKHRERKEKHFLVVKVLCDDEEVITHCQVEAIISHRQETIEWRELLDEQQWCQGWH